MKLVYFGRVRERIGLDEEVVDPPARIVAELLAWLRKREGGYADALDDLARTHVAVNLAMATHDAPIAPGDEVAIFSPVTGG